VAARTNVYELQAKLSVVLAIVGAACTLAGAMFIMGAFHRAEFQTVYNVKSMRQPLILGSLFLGGAAGAVGFLLGLLSAGQRLNKRNRLSWTGFFLSAGVIALALSCGVFFFYTRFGQEIRPGTAG
jgi:hypothetical protein